MMPKVYRHIGRACCLGLFLGAAWSLSVMPAAAQTLEESLATAYDSNPTLLSERASLRATNEAVPQALSGWRPNVIVGAQVGKQRTDSSGVFDSGVQNTTPREVGVTVTQFLYRGGRTEASTAQAEAEVLAARSNLINTEQAVLFNGVTSYMNVWRDQSILELTINNEAVLARQLEASRDRFEVGEITRTDVAQSESRLARATAERIAAEGALSASRAVFQEVIGIYPGELAQPPLLEEIPDNQDAIVEASLASNPSVLATEFFEKAAQHQIRVAVGALLPEISLRGDANTSRESSLEDSEQDELRILALIDIPIYQQGLVSSQVREFKQIASEARLDVDEARRNAKQSSISSWEALVTAQAQIKSLESEVDSQRIALDGVRQENAVGARTVLDVLDAEQDLLDAEVNLVEARRNDHVARYAVLQAMGLLTARYLGLPVEIYDPVEDYEAVRDSWFGLDAPGSE